MVVIMRAALLALVASGCDAVATWFPPPSEPMYECVLSLPGPVCGAERSAFADDAGFLCGADAGACPHGTRCTVVDAGRGVCAVGGCTCGDPCPDGHACRDDVCVPLACATREDCETPGRAGLAVCVDGCCALDATNPRNFPFATAVCDISEAPCAEPCLGGCDFERCGCAPHGDGSECALGFECWQVDDDTEQGLGVCRPRACVSPVDPCGQGSVCDWERGVCLPRACTGDGGCEGGPCVDGCCAR